MKRWRYAASCGVLLAACDGDAPDEASSPPPLDDAAGANGAPARADADAGAATPRPPGALNPGGVPSRKYWVLTAGDLNALYRTIAPNDPEKAWQNPLGTMQSQIMTDTLGLAGAASLPGAVTTVSCHLMASWSFDSGTGAEKAVGPCDWVDDMASANPVDWQLGTFGQKVAEAINASPHKSDVVFVSLITGETDANIFATTKDHAGGLAGSPYSAAEWADSAFRLGQFKKGFPALLRLVRTATGLPSLKLALQVFVGAGPSTDALQEAELEAADESNGDIIVGNGNPLEWTTSNPGFEGYRYYTGQSYMDLSLETGRAIAWSLGQSGLGDTLAGPCYGQFPRVESFTVSGAQVLLDVSNPNHAGTLVLPATAKTQGWHVYTDSTAGLVDYPVASVALVAPFRIALTLTKAAPANASVTYGDHSSSTQSGAHYLGLHAGGAVTDDASTMPCTEKTALPRRNMPLRVKPR